MQTDFLRITFAVISLTGAIVACNAKVEALDDRACPCTTGYTCCVTTNQCLAAGEVCPATQTTPNVSANNGDDDGGDGSNDVGVPDPDLPVTGTPMPAPADTQNVPFLPSTAKPGIFRVFISSAFHDGNLGGFDGADAFCRKMANAAGLGGKWAAYLNGATTTLDDRIHGDGPWYAMDGTTLLWANHDALTNDPRAQIPQDEAGRPYTPAYAWLGGSGPDYASCADWTTTGGDGAYVYANEPTSNFTNDPCATKHNLVCFEQP